MPYSMIIFYVLATIILLLSINLLLKRYRNVSLALRQCNDVMYAISNSTSFQQCPHPSAALPESLSVGNILPSQRSTTRQSLVSPRVGRSQEPNVILVSSTLPMPDESQEAAPTKPTAVDDLSELPWLPGDLITLPRGSCPVLDADEEVFILYSRHFENKDEDGIQGLGSVNSLAGNLSLSFTIKPPLPEPSHPEKFKPKGRARHKKASNSKSEQIEKTIEIEVFQDVTGLRSRKGDTGSVVWRASVHLAKLLLQQYYFPPHSPDSALLNPDRFANSRIVELGSGTGVLGCALLLLLSHSGHITLTDLPELTPLLRKNAKSDKVSVEPLDWTWQILPKFTADLVLCVDCIYNTALVRPLVRVLGTFDAPILVVVELRDEDVVREFLREWLEWRPHTGGQVLEYEGFQVYRLADHLLSPRFVAWIGWKA